MSSGIIQEVFKRYFDFYKEVEMEEMVITKEELAKMQDELIEKIKQNAPTHKTHSGNFNDDYCISINHFIRKLIGDNHD